MADKLRKGRILKFPSGVLDALEVLRRCSARDADVIPPGYRTVNQWAAEWGGNRSYTGELLRRGVDNGAADVIALRMADGRKVKHYRVKDAKNKAA